MRAVEGEAARITGVQVGVGSGKGPHLEE